MYWNNAARHLPHGNEEQLPTDLRILVLPARGSMVLPLTSISDGQSEPHACGKPRARWCTHTQRGHCLSRPSVWLLVGDLVSGPRRRGLGYRTSPLTSAYAGSKLYFLSPPLPVRAHISDRRPCIGDERLADAACMIGIPDYPLPCTHVLKSLVHVGRDHCGDIGYYISLLALLVPSNARDSRSYISGFSFVLPICVDWP